MAITVQAAEQNIDSLETLMPAVQKMAEVDCYCLEKEEHYLIVEKDLLRAIKEVLGENATDEILDAWKKAYGVIAQIFIDVEKQFYAKRA